MTAPINKALALALWVPAIPDDVAPPSAVFET
jgi:hypothetical protein